ncbi:MAG TPA: tyrosine-protein phosphatase [Caulobacteraceae bacterium]|nr:tyrosine-protein phosphatase [Caulobacteraceae bacterium]
MSRTLAFEGIDNFRDFGGYARADGRRLARGRLYRSAGHSRASDADLDRLAAMGLEVIIDLRRPDERLRDPTRRPIGFAGRVIDNDENAPDDWRAHLLKGDLSAESFRRYLLDYYRGAPFHARHLDLFSRYFAALAAVDGPVLVHCSAGKDRTGLLVALTHHMAGVHSDDILEDYLLTNDRERLARRAPLVAGIIEEMAGVRPSEAAVMTAMGVEAEYLETAFAAIEGEFGGVDAYLERGLGVDRALREDIEARLFE